MGVCRRPLTTVDGVTSRVSRPGSGEHQEADAEDRIPSRSSDLLAAVLVRLRPELMSVVCHLVPSGRRLYAPLGKRRFDGLTFARGETRRGRETRWHLQEGEKI